MDGLHGLLRAAARARDGEWRRGFVTCQAPRWQVAWWSARFRLGTSWPQSEQITCSSCSPSSSCRCDDRWRVSRGDRRIPSPPPVVPAGEAVLSDGSGGSFRLGLREELMVVLDLICSDDEENECFRKYKSASESYLDHSLFLKNKPRYSELFSLNITDYKGWAKGLKKAGYATDPNYANNLILKINNKVKKYGPRSNNLSKTLNYILNRNK